MLALMIKIDEQWKTGELMSSTVAIFFERTVSSQCILLQKVKPGTRPSLGAIYERLKKSREGMKEFEYVQNRDTSDTDKYKCFKVGPYNIRVASIAEPMDDSSPYLGLLIYRRIDVLRTLANSPKILLGLGVLARSRKWKLSTSRSQNANHQSRMLGLEENTDEEGYSATN
jgi:hypothetical protein